MHVGNSVIEGEKSIVSTLSRRLSFFPDLLLKLLGFKVLRLSKTAASNE
jgi:hypothetical protein